MPTTAHSQWPLTRPKCKVTKEVYFEDESHISMVPLSLLEGLKYYKGEEITNL